MDERLAKSALDQIAQLDLAEKVTLHVMGEPMLHPKFFDIVDHAHSLGIKIGLTTNGGLLKPDVIEALATRDLYQIDISLQTPDAVSFGKTRGTRMDFDKYKEGLFGLLAACHARPNPPIFKIRVMTTRFAAKLRENLGIPGFMASSKDLRETVLEWAQLVYERLGREFDPELVAKKLSKIKIYAWNVIEIAPNVFFETYVLTDWGNAFSEDKIIPADHGYCFGMRDHFAILHSGEVTLCCIDYEGKTAIGNLNESKLVDILSSAELGKIVRGFHKGRLEHEYCKQCLGSNSILSSWVKPALSILGLKVLKPFFYRKYRLY
jgi:MoaA/NifB/PqqE/SkfB family radical SAM enzyme